MIKSLRQIWVKFLIRQLEKDVLKSETTQRILIHNLLSNMNEAKKEEVHLEYAAPEVGKVKLIMIAYLTDK